MRRLLDSNEKALWGRVIASVEPLRKSDLNPPRNGEGDRPKGGGGGLPPSTSLSRNPPPSLAARAPPPRSREDKSNLDGHWDRRIEKGGIVPDVSVDLHDTGLSGAYARLDGALEKAIAQKMKVVLLVTGKARAHDRASGEGRGAIASVVRDWLASSRHSSSIAAVRGAHPRHGGTGALYIVLKR